ncbi:hypothetical protein [Aquabacter cavernae]|uniref:hypothetical protein n=1 Tax=Aquabacter cavernae TaxID=2496029 RepID=UPI000F8E0FFF|nr:hypothetical protein [Aquabacter cavernae]
MTDAEYDEEAEFEQLAKRAQELKATDHSARVFFEVMAQRERDPSATSIENLAKIIRSDRAAAVELARAFQDAQFGKFIVGRRGSVSRFEWWWSATSLAQVALGTDTDIPRVDPTQAGDDEASEEAREKDGDEKPVRTPSPPLMLTIPQAKEALSRTLGVPVESIEIIIRG